MVVDAVLRERSRVLDPPQPLRVRLVLAEEKLRVVVADEPAGAERAVGGLDDVVRDSTELRAPVVSSPRPRVAEPHRGEDVERGRLRAAIARLDEDADVVGRALRVRELDIEVPGLLEHTGVDELVLVLFTASVPVALDEVGVGERALRVLVQPAHVRVRRRRVERPPVLLRVFAVVAFGVRQAEEAFFQDGVVRVPQRDGEAEVLPVVADAAQAVLAPAVRARAGVLVGERVPRGASGAVVLAHGAPLARREVRTPPSPQRYPVAILVESALFGVVAHECGQFMKASRTLPERAVPGSVRS